MVNISVHWVIACSIVGTVIIVLLGFISYIFTSPSKLKSINRGPKRTRLHTSCNTRGITLVHTCECVKIVRNIQ